MVGIFKANTPFNSFLLFIYGFLLKLSWFIHPRIPAAQDTDNFLFLRFLSFISTFGNRFPVIYPTIAYLLLYAQAIALNKVVNAQRLITKPNYLPGMTFLLITSLFGEWNMLTSPLLITTLLIWVLGKMTNLNNIQKPKALLFNIGAIIGIATFFYFPALAFAVLVIMALIVMRAFRLDEWVMVAIGIITPYYFLYAYLFIADKIQDYRLPAFAVGYPKFSPSYWSLAAMIIVMLGFVIGGYYVRKNMRRQLVHTRKAWNIILLYLVVAVFVPFVNSTYRFEYWVLTAIPLSTFIACAFFYPTKAWIPNLLHWGMVGLVVAITYFYG